MVSYHEKLQTAHQLKEQLFNSVEEVERDLQYLASAGFQTQKKTEQLDTIVLKLSAALTVLDDESTICEHTGVQEGSPEL